MKISCDYKIDDPHIWENLNDLFNGEASDFPCLFAISSFNKGAMRISVIDENEQEISKSISSDLIKLSSHLSEDLIEPDLSLITYLAIITNKVHHDISFDETLFLTNLLQGLFNIDPVEWPENKTKNMNDQNFEFYHNGRVLFPVFLSPSHRSKIRRSPFVMIAFQPGRTFDYNKTERKDLYERMRKSIHRRIDTFYNDNRPHYLSKKSSGKNICQYVGYDQTEIDRLYTYKELAK